MKKKLFWIENTSKNNKCPNCGSDLITCSFSGKCPKCWYKDGFALLTKKESEKFKSKIEVK